MRVVLRDGTEFSCRNFKAIESGVLLTKDKKRKKVIGFVPNHQVKYVVPDDLEPEVTTADERETVAAGQPDELVHEPNDDLTVGPPATAQPETDGRSAAAAETDVGVVGDDTAAESDLRRLGGLGSTYAERLQAAGYETLADLAAADPVAVAEAASVAPGRGRRWVNAATRAVASVERGADNEAEADGADEEPTTGEGDDGDDTADAGGGDSTDSDASDEEGGETSDDPEGGDEQSEANEANGDEDETDETEAKEAEDGAETEE